MIPGIGAQRRAQTLERLRSETFDLLVVGAGIVGSRIAYEAAQRGLRVALADAGDFGGATSSASSKLIHGGLRYLRQFELGLVREALRERRVLRTRVAPHLVRRLTFLLPFYRGGPWHPVMVGAGLVLYSALAGFRESEVRLLATRRARGLVPALRPDGLRAAGLFEDAQTDDARLCLATVTAAARAGAAVLNHAPVVAFEHGRGAIGAASVAPREGPGALTVRCRAVVNAAGPWVDVVRRLDDPGAAPLVRLSKGVHLTLPLEDDFRAALIVPVDRDRVTFAIPWQGLLLLGTTDTPYDGDPGPVEAAPEDARAVLTEAGLALPAAMLDERRVRFRFAGLRALPAGESTTARAPREHVIAVSRTGLISVAGGKLTTHRLIAVDALRRLPRGLLSGSPSIRPDATPLPGAGAVGLPPRTEVDPAIWTHLVQTYGAAATAVLGYGAREAGALERIHPEGPDVWAQAAYAVDEEWAATVEDIARRRTAVSLRGLADESVRARLQALLAGRGAALP